MRRTVVDSSMTQKVGTLVGTYTIGGGDGNRQAGDPQDGPDLDPSSTLGTSTGNRKKGKMTQTERRQAEPFGPWYDRFRADTICDTDRCWQPITELTDRGWQCHDHWIAEQADHPLLDLYCGNGE